MSCRLSNVAWNVIKHSIMYLDDEALADDTILGSVSRNTSFYNPAFDTLIPYHSTPRIKLPDNAGISNSNMFSFPMVLF